jgi:hypothetical protein
VKEYSRKFLIRQLMDNDSGFGYGLGLGLGSPLLVSFFLGVVIDLSLHRAVYVK